MFQPLPSSNPQDACMSFYNPRELRVTSNFTQPMRSNLQDRHKIRLQSCRFEYNRGVIESSPKIKEDKDEKPQRSDTHAVRLLEKVLKEKNLQIENQQSTKKTLQSKSKTILTERSLNVSLERRDEQNLNTLTLNLPHKLKQIPPPRRSLNGVRDENNPAIASRKEPVAASKCIKKLEKCPIDQILYISRSSINFGNQMPGQIVNESLDIVNKTNKDLIVQIFVECENAEFKDMDEYVYSIRRNHGFEYNDKHFLMMTPYSSASFKVGLKVPNVKKELDNKGYIDISIQGLTAAQRIRLESKIVIPKLICTKTLYHKDLKCNIINLAVQPTKRHDFKLPFKNQGNVPLDIEFMFYDREDHQDNDDILNYSIFNQTMLLEPKTTGVVNLCIKPANIQNGLTTNGIKKIILAKIKDTNVVYSFCLWIHLH